MAGHLGNVGSRHRHITSRDVTTWMELSLAKKFTRDAKILGVLTAESIASALKLFVKITGGSSTDISEPALLFLRYFEGDQVDEPEYIRGLSRSVDDSLWGTPIWAISLKYKIVYGDEPWDIEASHRTFNSNGRVNGQWKSRFYLDEIIVTDNSGIPNHAEEEFLSMVKRLSEILKETELKIIERQDEVDDWSTSMSAKGYIKGPQFPSYEELSIWDLSNKRPHVRSRTSQGFQVYFTDGNSEDESRIETTATSKPHLTKFDDDIPF